jgi:hypothetical protein
MTFIAEAEFATRARQSSLTTARRQLTPPKPGRTQDPSPSACQKDLQPISQAKPHFGLANPSEAKLIHLDVSVYLLS